MRSRLTLTPSAYRRVALFALFTLTAIVLTGAAVRLTGSGLGCPDWPKCYGQVIAPLKTHAVIEYGNRIFSGIVGLAAVSAGLLAWRRRPFRRDLAALGALLPLGVVGQAVLGGFTVRHHLAPGFVMAHYALSMLVLVAALALAWRSSHEPGERPRGGDRVTVWGVRVLLPLGALTVFAGTAATAAGPHAGSAGTGEHVNRLDFKGAETLRWAVGQHARVAAVFGVLAVAVWLIGRYRRPERERQRALGTLIVLLGIQGIVGAIQYRTELPAELVWVHVALATLTWLAVLWATAAAGTLSPAPEGQRAEALQPRAAPG